MTSAGIGLAAGERLSADATARSRSRDHRFFVAMAAAFFWGGLFLMISLPVRFGVTQTEGWLALARWLTQ